MRPQCTKSKNGREVRRHRRQQELDQKRAEGRGLAGRRDVRTRQHLMERSFARGKRYGYDRARWRGLWRVQIQELLTCAVQNIQVLIARTGPRSAVHAQRRGFRLGPFLATITCLAYGQSQSATRCPRRILHAFPAG